MTSYDPNRALVVVDCQNDFADPKGSLFVTGAESVITEANRHIIAAVAADAPVVYTQDWHPPDTPHFEKDGGLWPVHCVASTWGADFHPRLILVGPSVRKGSNGEDGYSGFTMRDPGTGEETPTDLHRMLQNLGVERVVVVGLALDYCVKGTAADAVRLGYPVSLPLAATAAVDLQPGDGSAAAAELVAVGVDVV